MKTIAWIETYMTQAEQLIFDGSVQEGLNILSNLLYEEPGYGSLHNHIGWAYMYHAVDEAKAELHFKMAIRFAPDFAAPYLHIGNLMSRKGEYTQAIQYFREGLTKPGANKSALLEGIAQAHELRSEFRLAINVYREAAHATVIDFEVDRMLNAVKRCRRKRMAALFSLW